MATEEERRKRRFGIGTISPEDQQRFDKTTQAGKSIVQTGKNVVSDISRAFSAAPAVAADYSGSRGNIAETITNRQNPRQQTAGNVLENAGTPTRGFGGMATMPQKPKPGEAQAATLPQQPVQDIAATRQKRVFEPQQQEIAKTPKTSQFGGRFRPVPQRPGAGQMIEWYKDGEVPGYSYAGTEEAKAFNEARDREFGPMQKKPEEQLKEQYLSAQTPEEKKRISQDIAAMSGTTQQGLTQQQRLQAERELAEDYQKRYSGDAAQARNPLDYMDEDMTTPLPPLASAYKYNFNNAMTLYGKPDAQTYAILSANSDPQVWREFIAKPKEEQFSILRKFMSGD